ncbi:MAG: 4Fe-4S binding protein [Candidatus Omnitrophica bacterium]|nr:4Fe-4S binding protein [Candidatus Omnitrophota bacterium]MCM8830803.1 4Fe-4S binding protein [Candidatus Omnitrophota bacterium]
MYSKKIVLKFPSHLVDKPIVYRLSKDFNLEFNILKALITQYEEGLLILELKGEKKDYDAAIEYLQKEGVTIETLSKDVKMNDKCTSCGVCIPMCPVSAFEINPETKEIVFRKEKCVGCELCIKICPYRAMEVKI